MTPDAAMLFAAGFGTRMQPLTWDTPKPLIRVAGRPLLDHARDQIAPMELSKVVANAHYLHDQITAHLDGSGIVISHETPDILDTGGGLRHALPHLGPGPVYTLNTDIVWVGPNPLETLCAQWDPTRMDALLLCVPLDRTVGREGGGDFSLAAEGTLIRGGDLVYTGAQIVTTDRLSAIPDTAFSLNLIWDEMAKDGRLFGTTYSGTWCDVGSPAGIELAEAALRDV